MSLTGQIVNGISFVCKILMLAQEYQNFVVFDQFEYMLQGVHPESKRWW
jgi:hypothetical protein